MIGLVSICVSVKVVAILIFNFQFQITSQIEIMLFMHKCCTARQFLNSFILIVPHMQFKNKLPLHCNGRRHRTNTNLGVLCVRIISNERDLAGLKSCAQ